MNFDLSRSGWLALVLLLAPAAALAAQQGGRTPGADEAILVADVVLLILTGRLLGELMLRIGQPTIVGQLLAGVILGPTVFGAFWPHAHNLVFPHDATQKAMITSIAQIGVLLLLLLTGMETDLRLVKRAQSTAIAVSLTGIAIPFGCGVVLGQWLPDSLLPAGGRLVSSLFLGTALSISSVKIVASVIREMNFMRRDLGQVIVASAIIEDSVGWVIIAVTLGIAQKGSVDTLSLLKTVIGVGIFLALSFTAGQYAVFRIIRWVNDSFRSEFAVVTAILLIMGCMALTTYALGVQTVLGAFVAGILIGQSPILTDHIQNQLRGLVAALFMPVFFGQAGISTNLSILGHPQLLGLTAIVIAIASIGKFSGAFAGGKLSGMSVRESLAIGCGMNARGSTEVIVATIGLAMGAVTQDLFTMIVTMAMVTTMAMPPMLRIALARLPIRKEEKARLEREEMDARGFIAKLERIALAVDNSASGKFAARLAGYVAGVSGMPLTVMHVDKAASIGPPEAHEKEIREGAEQAAAATAEAEADTPRPVDISRQPAEPSAAPEWIAQLSRKGFDLLVIGIDRVRAPEGGFSQQVSELVNGFEGPVALLVPPLEGDARLDSGVLVPVTGTDFSRRGAEIGMVIARAAQLSVRAIYATPGRQGRSYGRNRRNHEAALKDIARLGIRYDVEVATQIDRHELPEAPILKIAVKRGDLIVMGVSRRPGESLFFGNTAAALMSRWAGPILFVAT